ncbi:unnamed protein product, partial [Didymodactylos carnosus]
MLPFTPKSTSKSRDISVRKDTSRIIMTQMNDDDKPLGPSKIVQLEGFFDELFKKLFNLIANNGVVRPVETELIQMIIGLITEMIHDLNLELAVFHLSLPKRLSSSIHKLPKPNQELSNLIDLMTKTDNTNTVRNEVPITSIKNVHVFLESIVATENKFMEKYDTIPTISAHYDKDQSYIKLLDKARGCTTKCDDGNKDSYSTGHQLRAFSSIKFEITNEASLKQCHEIDNNGYIVVRGH